MAAETPATPAPPPPAPTRARWSVGRILLVVFGCIVALLAVALLGAGGTTLWADRTQRDDDGYLTTPTERFETEAYAITSESIDLFEGEEGGEWLVTEGVLGKVRITGESDTGDVFIGIGATEDVDSYLDGVEHDEVRRFADCETAASSSWSSGGGGSSDARSAVSSYIGFVRGSRVAR